MLDPAARINLDATVILLMSRAASFSALGERVNDMVELSPGGGGSGLEADVDNEEEAGDTADAPAAAAVDVDDGGDAAGSFPFSFSFSSSSATTAMPPFALLLSSTSSSLEREIKSRCFANSALTNLGELESCDFGDPEVRAGANGGDGNDGDDDDDDDDDDDNDVDWGGGGKDSS